MDILGLYGILIILKNKMYENHQIEKRLLYVSVCLSISGSHLIFFGGVWHTQDPSIFSFSFHAYPSRHLWCRHLFSQGSLNECIHNVPLLIPNQQQSDEEVFPAVAVHAASSLFFKLWLT